MPSFNQVIIIGNVGKEIEMRFTPNGNPVSTFSVAVNNTYTKDGEKVTETEWFNVTCWNKLAEVVNQYAGKGMPIFVEGRLKTRSWEGKDGQKHYKTEIIASRVQLLGKKEAAAAEQGEHTEELGDLPF